MSLRRPAKNQPKTFEFSSSSMKEANKIVLKYIGPLNEELINEINSIIK